MPAAEEFFGSIIALASNTIAVKENYIIKITKELEQAKAEQAALRDELLKLKIPSSKKEGQN